MPSAPNPLIAPRTYENCRKMVSIFLTCVSERFKWQRQHQRRQWLWRLLLLLLLFSSHLIFKFIQILLRVGGTRFGSFLLEWEQQGGDESALRIYVNYYGCDDLSSHRENNAPIHSFNTNLTIIRYVPALVNCPVHIFNVDIITSSNYVVALATRNNGRMCHVCASRFHTVSSRAAALPTRAPPKWTCNYFLGRQSTI